jgi:hypothetical protein
MYPYHERFVQGEPNGPLPQPAHLITSIAPQDIYTTPYLPPNLVRGSSFSGQGGNKPPQGDERYVKRPRRRAEEVERFYACNYPGCDKAYGALNHLNTHVRNANHGPKREPKGTTYRVPYLTSEFQEIRRELKMRQAQERASKTSPLRTDVVYRSGSQPSLSSMPYEHSRLDGHAYPTIPLHTTRVQQPTRYFPYASQAISAREMYPAVPEDNPREDDWYTPPPGDPIHSKRWSPDNFSDLQTRHPTFAKDLLSHSKREDPSISPEIITTHRNEHYEPHNSGHYVQGPNGSGHSRDPYRSYVRKEFQ